jgi:hypothetical protein
MIIKTHKDTTVIQTGDLVIVTRPTVMGGVATHVIRSPYGAAAIALWLETKHSLVQSAFPEMSADDREFLISGITPAKWNEMFPKEEQD